MREYVVQPGDSPASIAAQSHMAGCPKCAIDLIRANPLKATVTLPNGFVTFRELEVGEKLRLPEKWWSKEFDDRPPAYFAALPYHDGVTPGKFGVGSVGVLADYAAFDVAAARVSALSALGDQPFSAAVNVAAAAIEASLREISTGEGAPTKYAAPYIQSALTSVAQARQRNVDLVTAINAGDQAGAFQARLDILHYLSDALSSAQLALQAFYGDVNAQDQTPTSTIAPTIAAVAQAAVAAIGADPNYCAAVAQPGSAVNATLHAFKTAWNSANPSWQVPINTSSYEQDTANALARLLGSAPAACATRVTPPTPPSPPVQAPSPILVSKQEKGGVSVGAVIGLGLLGAGAVGGAFYLVSSKRPTRRVRKRSPGFRKRNT